MFHKNQLVKISNPESVNPNYTDGILIGRIVGFRSKHQKHKVVFNKLIFLKKDDAENLRIWVELGNKEVNPEILRVKTQHKENKIEISKKEIQHLTRKEKDLYTKRFARAEKHAKAFNHKRINKIAKGLYSTRN